MVPYANNKSRITFATGALGAVTGGNISQRCNYSTLSRAEGRKCRLEFLFARDLAEAVSTMKHGRTHVTGRREKAMQADIEKKRDALAALCRQYGVARLEVFGSAARDVGFDPNRSDADFLVTFKDIARNDLTAFTDLKDALERLLGRPVDLVEREAIEMSRNFIRRRAILKVRHWQGLL